jgi:hypothetical protein
MSGLSISNGTIPTTSVSGTAVDCTNAQTIGGAKTFSIAPIMSGASILTETIPVGSVSGTAVDCTTSQQIGGAKTFSTAPIMSGASILNGTIPTTSVLGTAVDCTNAQTIGGAKTFTGSTIIGTSSASANLTVNGTVEATSFNAASDYRIKEDVLNLNNSVNNSNFTVDNLRPVTYKNILSGKQDMGFIAHELQEHYPFLVTGEKDGPDNQSVNYIGLIALLVKEIQELKKHINNNK